ncbi:MAG: EamA family transporter [Candidatus Lokiarchaeota archaeon]|nr:EamA family transporter [Candidatus Lokiarchaeota archaeon]
MASLEALVVTILWSSSYVIIKLGLEEVPPLLFSGLRYSVASVVLIGFVLSQGRYRKQIVSKEKTWWGIIAVYGVIFVAFTQGAHYVALSLLPAITESMLLNLTPVIVLLMGIIFLDETPTKGQLLLIFIGLVGILIYFFPLNLPLVQVIGLFVAIGELVANALSSLLGRKINRDCIDHPVVITSLSMGIGSVVLLLSGIILEGMVPISPISLVYILWLAIINTAFAFTLWNRAMRVLRAVDVSLINSTMLPQIVVLSVLFLGEMPDILDWVGLVLFALSIALIQISQAKRKGAVKD